MSKFNEGNSVVVNQNIHDPDFDICIEGWQGRISEIDTQANLICIEWDSFTLSQMPSEIIEQCEEEGWDWKRMFLQIDEVELTHPRDKKEDVKSTIDYLNKKYWWSSFGEEGKRIDAVLNRKDGEDEFSAFEAWEKYLTEVLDFPFKAVIARPQEKGQLQSGNKVKVWGTEGSEDLYGIIMNVHLGRRKHACPLCELEVMDKSSTNYQPIEDYKTWFANR